MVERSPEKKERPVALVYCFTCGKTLYEATKSYPGLQATLLTIATAHKGLNPTHSVDIGYTGLKQ